jgi:hypothetical protein
MQTALLGKRLVSNERLQQIFQNFMAECLASLIWKSSFLVYNSFYFQKAEEPGRL